MRLPYDTLAVDGLKALGGVYAYVQRCGLEKKLVDLAYLRTSQINGCATASTCIHMMQSRKASALRG
jgi:AhpD family alkylhydroperoxidase